MPEHGANVSGVNGVSRVHAKRDGEGIAAAQLSVLARFVRELSPGRVVRAAVADERGEWPNAYAALLPVAELDDETGPVAMYLACRRRRWGGQYRYRYVLLDLDVGRGGLAAVQQQAAALTELLRSHGIAAVRVTSGPSGGVHLWTACPAGLAPAVVSRIAEAARVLFPTVDPAPLLNPRQGAARPPGALHRAGGRAHLTDRTVGEAIATLRAGAPRERFEALLSTLEGMAGAPALWNEQRARVAAPSIRTGRLSVPPSVAKLGPLVRSVATDARGRPRVDVPARPLGTRAQAAVLRRPRAEAGAHSASAHLTLKWCALAGWTHDQVAEFAADPERSPSLEWLRTGSTGTDPRTELDTSERDRRFTRAWWIAVQAAARMPRRPSDGDDGAFSEAAEAAAELLGRIEAAGAAPWRRPSGPADRAVLRAVAWLMVTSAETEVSADVRRIAVLSGYSKSTAALALARLILDGWIEVAKHADMSAGIARRVRLGRAEAHRCPSDKHHMCANFSSDQEQYGSDRSPNAPPLVGSSKALVSQLGATIAHQQAGLWHRLGHHAARSLEAVQARPGISLEALRQHTGYTTPTVTRHATMLAALGLVELQDGPEGVRATRTARTLYEAGTATRTATRPAELATVAAVEVEVARWWRQEVAWCRLTKRQKRVQGRRAHARQAVVPGTDPYARAYPRHPGATGRPDRGDADHATAFGIEAERINAGELAQEADELARRGHVVDPARLAHRSSGGMPVMLVAAA